MTHRARVASGHALIIALVLLVLVGAAATAIAVTLQLESRVALQEARRIHLVALGDAAVAEALAELDHNPGFAGTTEHRLGRGTIATSVRSLDLDRSQIVATATFSGWRREVWALVDTGGETPRVLRWKVLR